MPALYTLCLILLTGLLAWGCDSSIDTPTIDPSRTVVQVVRDQPELSSFYTALERANLLGSLRNQNLGFTLFAPTNAAFAAYLQAAGYGSLEEVPLSALEPLLQYHISLGSKTASNLDSTLLNTLAGIRLFAYGANNTVVLNNGIELAQSDLRASNGVVHILDDVLTPPKLSLAGLIAASAEAEGEYTLLQAALSRAGLVAMLNDNAQRLTLFAPTDAAFMAAGYASVADFENEDEAVLRNILMHHLLANYRFSHMLRSGSFRSLQGDSVLIDAAAGTIQGSGNTQPAALIPAQLDQYTTNGVLHGIDAVLLPE